MADTHDETGAPPAATPTSKEDLEALFGAWDERRAAEAETESAPESVSRAWTYDPFRLWLSLTIILVAIAGSIMWTTRHEVAYFLQRGSEPTDLGRLSEQWRSGVRDLEVASNHYVTVSGMFATYEAELAADESEGLGAEHIYHCPLFNIAVRATTAPPQKPFHKIADIEIDAEYLPLLQDRRVFPVDLTVETGATGRLIRGTEVPPWHAQVLKYFALQVGADPYEMWLLVEGERPEDARAYAVVWLGGIVTILMALALFLRAWGRRRSPPEATA